jgi:hypothetical protein
LNPRYGFPHARFRGECFQPLSHLSAAVAIASLTEEFVVQQCNRSQKLAPRGEKRLQDGGGFGGENACRDFDLMVEARIGKDFEARADGAALGVVGAVDKARDAGLNDRTGTHAAGLNGNVERGVCEAIVAEESCGFTKHDDFGVGGWVVVADGAVTGTGENLSLVNQDGSDGHFAGAG